MALCSYHHCIVNDWKIWRCKYFILINFLAEKILWNIFPWNSFLQFYFEITKINLNLLPSYESIPKRQLISWLRRNKAEETSKVGQWSSKKIVTSVSMKDFKKWWKVLFISSSKLFWFSRHLNFCLDFLVMSKNCLIRNMRLIPYLWRHNLVNKQLQYTYCPTSHKVKATRQWNFDS